MNKNLQVTIARGNLYVPLGTYETYLKNIEAVALLPHEKGILLFPLIQQSAGGLLLKIRNLRGDRVIHSQEFFRNNNLAESNPDMVAALRGRMEAWIAKRMQETGLPNPIENQGDWHGHEGVGTAAPSPLVPRSVER